MFAKVFYYGILVFLVGKIIASQKARDVKRRLVYVMLLLVLVLIPLSITSYDTFNKKVFFQGLVYHLLCIQFVTTPLKLLVICSCVLTVYAVKDKRYSKIPIYLLLLLSTSFYLDIIKERNIITGKMAFSSPMLNVIEPFFKQAQRYPLRLEEVITSKKMYDEINNIYNTCLKPNYLQILTLNLLNKPNFAVKTWLADTIVHCRIYCYGFDYDDDNLKNEVDLYGNRRLFLSIPFLSLYILSPIALDGDIILPTVWSSSIYDYRLDTTFVRQLRELQGDTLSPEEYKEWLKKREEFKRKEFGLE